MEIGSLRHDGTHEPGRDVDEQQGGYRQRHDGKLEKQAEMAPINREGSVEDPAEVQGPNVRHRDSLPVRGGGKMLRGTLPRESRPAPGDPCTSTGGTERRRTSP